MKIDASAVREAGQDLANIADELSVLAERAWEVYARLKQQLAGADPGSEAGQRLETLVIAVGRHIPGSARAVDLQAVAEVAARYTAADPAEVMRECARAAAGMALCGVQC